MRKNSFLLIPLLWLLLGACTQSSNEGRSEANLSAPPAEESAATPLSLPIPTATTAKTLDGSSPKAEDPVAFPKKAKGKAASIKEKASALAKENQFSLSVVPSDGSASIFEESTTYEPKEMVDEEEKPGTELQALFKELDKPFQTFFIETGKFASLTGEQGTTFIFPAHAFVLERTGKEPKGKLEVRIKEYYSVSDFLLGNLSTVTTNKEILETGGTVFIEVLSGEEPCKLKQGESMDVIFPFRENKENMQIFHGNTNRSGIVEWETAKVSPNRKPKYYYLNFKNALYAGSLAGALARGGTYGKEVKRKGKGKVVMKYIVNSSGELQPPVFVGNPKPELENLAHEAVRKLHKKWWPALYEEQQVKDWGTATFRYSRWSRRPKVTIVKNSIGTKYTDLLSYRSAVWKIERANGIETTNIDLDRPKEISEYLLSSNLLGWINCDRFRNSNEPRVDFVIEHSENDNTFLSVIFHEINSIAPAFSHDHGSVLPGVPLGSLVTVVAVRKTGDQSFLAVQEATISRQAMKGLTFEPVTMERLKEEIQKLDPLFSN